jgi:hypothetical protein
VRVVDGGDWDGGGGSEGGEEESNPSGFSLSDGGEEDGGELAPDGGFPSSDPSDQAVKSRVSCPGEDFGGFGGFLSSSSPPSRLTHRG